MFAPVLKAAVVSIKANVKLALGSALVFAHKYLAWHWVPIGMLISVFLLSCLGGFLIMQSDGQPLKVDTGAAKQ